MDSILEIWVVTVRTEVCLVSPAGQPSCLHVPSVLLALGGVVIQSAGCFPLLIISDLILAASGSLCVLALLGFCQLQLPDVI